MKYLGYIVTGLLSAAVAGGASYFVTKRVVSKQLKEKYENSLAEQLNACREYYNTKNFQNNLAEIKKIYEDQNKEYDSEEEAKEDIHKKSKLVISDPEKKKAGDVIDEQAMKEYHKMYGTPTVETLFDDEDDDDEFEEMLKKTGPYLIKRATYFNEIDEESKPYDKVELILFTGDFIRKEDGEKEYLEIMYADGIANERFDENGDLIPINPKTEPYYERVLKSAEIAAALGVDWRHHIGDDEDYDYDENEVFVRNDNLKTDFSIIRDDRMYKCVVAGLEPGDDFNYDEVR